MSTEASTELQEIYSPVAEEIGLLDAFLRGEFASREPFIYRILQHISRFRGKQIRPALLFLTNRLAGGKVSSDVVKIGGVLEMIHTATLVHDDLLDDARLRRNVGTVHTRWGERAAILIGDFIYSRAFQLSTEVPGMARILSETTHTICEGELLQIGHRFVPNLSEETYFEIIRKKTASLYAVASKVGGLFSGLDVGSCERLYEFGQDIGMAFQIVDDCLDYSGKENVVGKSLGTDLHQGKVTLPLIYLREALSRGEQEWLRHILENPLDVRMESRIHDLVRDVGALEESFQRAESFIERAKAALGDFCADGTVSDPGLRDSLELIVDYVLKRQR